MNHLHLFIYLSSTQKQLQLIIYPTIIAKYCKFIVVVQLDEWATRNRHYTVRVSNCTTVFNVTANKCTVHKDERVIGAL